ncbi:homeobox protein pv.1-like [Pseudophryne corroboree]|uniref:homeobox protein pv.1-like n=1 Tax=Pseudophryne corroboree TaxID=495146 RepID=UPI003081F51F
MVRQSFSIDFILTGSKEEALASKVASKPHIPCVPQPQPPCRHSARSIQPKRKDSHAEPSGDTEPFKSFPEKHVTCLQNGVSSLIASHRGWVGADELTPSCSEDECEQASSHSSESGQPEEDDHGGTSPKSDLQRRMRTAFTSQQICKLEEMFKKQRYLGSSERKKLASTLQLSEIQVKTWFQNRRMKLKRQMQDHQHRLSTSSAHYPHPISYYHGPPVPVNNMHFYPTQAHSYQQPADSPYHPDPRFLSLPVPHQFIMNNAQPEQYNPFYSTQQM